MQQHKNLASTEQILNEVSHPTFSNPSGHAKTYQILYTEYGSFMLFSCTVIPSGTIKEVNFYSVYMEVFLFIHLFIYLVIYRAYFNDCSYLAGQYCGCMFNYFSGSMWPGNLFSICVTPAIQRSPVNRHLNNSIFQLW